MLDRETILDLSLGRWPDDVDPDSSEGRHIMRLLMQTRRDVNKAPKPDEATKRRVLEMLRGWSS